MFATPIEPGATRRILRSAYSFEPGAVWRIARAYVIALSLLVIGQRYVLYQPSATEASPAEFSLAEVKAERFVRPDGESLVVWSARPTTRKQTILYFHGNGGSLANRTHRFRAFVDKGFGIAVLSYRGYGGSGGSPTEKDNVADAIAYHDHLVEGGLKAENIIVFGESLGSGVAVQLLAERRAAGLVLDSPFSSVADVAAAKFWWMPVRYLLWDTYDSMAHIGRLQAPLLMIVAGKDTVIPPRFGKALFAAAPEPKQLFLREGHEHTPPFDAEMWQRFEAFLLGAKDRQVTSVR